MYKTCINIQLFTIKIKNNLTFKIITEFPRILLILTKNHDGIKIKIFPVGHIDKFKTANIPGFHNNKKLNSNIIFGTPGHKFLKNKIIFNYFT